MQTPAKYLHIKDMPKVLPCEYFSDELNQALMAKNDMELLAAGMCVACSQVGSGPLDLWEFQMKVEFDRDWTNGKTLQQRYHEQYVKMVDLMIMSRLEWEIECQFGGEDLNNLESGNEGDAKKPRLAEGEDK